MTFCHVTLALIVPLPPDGPTTPTPIMASSVLLASESASSSTSRSAPNTSTTTPSASIPTPAPAPAPAEDPMIRLTTIDELFQQIDRVPGDILIVTRM